MSENPYLDRSRLPEALFEFVIISDSHYMLDVDPTKVEFKNRLKQTARRKVALDLAASLNPAFTLHLGDMIQEYPITDDFKRAMNEAVQQMKDCGVEAKYVAGNHDVGDKPDPTMPGDHINPEFLDWYHEKFGRSWYSFDEGPCHFVVLNSQIMNTGLPEEPQQTEWLERDLAETKRDRIFVFIHLPPYLYDKDEASLGHYDNINVPARSWLLNLVEQYKVEALFAGHVHFGFFDHAKDTRFFVATSPAFSRPGFPHAFTAPPPPQRGREDTAKLGIYLARVLKDRTDVHLIRTNGKVDWQPNGRQMITRLPKALPQSPLGVTLRHSLVPRAEIPMAWPATIRQRIRNDYPLMALLEMGVRHVRTAHTDFLEEFARSRLAILQKEGVQITAIILWDENNGLPDIPDADTIEVQILATAIPSERCLESIRSIQKPVSLSTLFPRDIVAGKQHPRHRIGFLPEELEALDDLLGEAGIKIERALCKSEPMSRTLENISSLDFALSFHSLDDDQNVTRAAEFLQAIRPLHGSRVFFDPLIDLDRTMDTSNGLLDTLCNPRPVFHALRCLNTILFSDPSAPLPATLDLQELSKGIAP